MDESSGPPGHVPTDMSAAAAPRLSLGHERERLWRALLARVAQSDRDAFASLYDASSSLVYSLASRILGNRADAEEVTLDVYLQVWRDAGRFDAERGGVTSWLVTIARSRALDRYRSHQTRLKREAGPVEADSPSGAPSPERLSVMSQERRVVASAIASLTPEQRQVIDLAYFHGMSQSEMADHLGLPLGTVKTRVRLGMMRLREQIGDWAG